ncbi:hypothetical protein [Litoreibacter janthinus]|uniref:HlyD family secretion protein n=1 Tax=Litoreibacter janthinus TaxID=670154 RepID=A0A1I6GPM6_9RHOB|nr:hypothetical protein [Litoreibacter janthinus]SFR44007.1 hypothetical protein SAMN04488002_1791 [Litoreibacter janthinus]
MSSPNTNLEKQKTRHAGPLSGMGAGLLFAGVLFVALIGWTVYQGGEPDGAEVQIDGRTGEASVVVTE